MEVKSDKKRQIRTLPLPATSLLDYVGGTLPACFPGNWSKFVRTLIGPAAECATNAKADASRFLTACSLRWFKGDRSFQVHCGKLSCVVVGSIHEDKASKLVDLALTKLGDGVTDLTRDIDPNSLGFIDCDGVFYPRSTRVSDLRARELFLAVNFDKQVSADGYAS